MPGTVRHRLDNNETDIIGFIDRPPFGKLNRTVRAGVKKDCIDTVGNRREANYFYLLTEDHGVAVMNGQYGSKGAFGSIEVSTCGMLSTTPVVPVPGYGLGSLSEIDKNAYAWEILSSTNPNQPHVNVPAYILEMRDLPELLMRRGQTLLDEVASGILTWQFAFKPMIGDLRKMLDFQKAAQQRFNYLKRLEEGKGMRRRVQLGQSNGGTDWGALTVFNSIGPLVRGKTKVKYSRKLWGTVEYGVLPGTHAIPKDDVAKRDLAYRLTTGITAHNILRTAWELMPWSWLIDWFANVGDLIDATDNTIPLLPRNICLMIHSTGRRSYVITEAPTWLHFSGIQFESSDKKERHRVYPILPFNFSIPAISAGQWSVLGSLGVLKANSSPRR